MKHSKREKTTRGQKGFSKGKNDSFKRQGPIMIEEILTSVAKISKTDMSIREMEMRTDPTNDASPRIKRRFKPLDNPETVLEVLRGILVIKEGVIGNNVTTGPLQYQYWRTCLDGTALNKFNEFATQIGTETTAHLILVERRFVAFFAPREVLNSQTRYIRHYMRKPYDVSTRRYVGAVNTLNNALEQLPPSFDASQKILDQDMMDILASNAPKSHKELMTDQGFDPQTATTDQFVEICERAECKEALRTKHDRNRSEDDSSEDERPSKKSNKKRTSVPYKAKRAPYFCKEHGPNTTHDSKDCKVLSGKKDWKKKDTFEKSEYKNKYKKKTRELNLLQKETRKEKAKWTRAYNKLNKSTDSNNDTSDGEVSKRSDAVRSKRDTDDSDSSSSASNSSSSSDTDSE